MRCITVESPSGQYLCGRTMIPTHNSPIAACFINRILFEDGEYGGEIYGAASEYQQASLVFDHVKGMILLNDDLRSRCKINSGQ